MIQKHHAPAPVQPTAALQILDEHFAIHDAFRTLSMQR